MTGVAKNTIIKLLASAGVTCTEYQDKVLRRLNCKRIQCDEIWSFCYAKAKNVPADKEGQFGYGDVWTWTAMDADTKLIVSWCVGARNAGTAFEFMHDLASRLANRIQLTTDGHRVYLTAAESAFGSDIDYAMLVKVYNSDDQTDTKYSPAEHVDFQTVPITGQPNPKHISTSFVERQNLIMRMSMRRFTRLTTAFSKRVENHAHAVALHFMHYNFCRLHQTLRVPPAMEARVTDHVWSIQELVGLLK